MGGLGGTVYWLSKKRKRKRGSWMEIIMRRGRLLYSKKKDGTKYLDFYR